jgi:general secretion pathway protein G
MNRHFSKLSFHQLQSGLTLVELMIVVAIIGVLASIAIPAYEDHIEKARVAQAVSDIVSISLKAEAYWNDERKYPDSLADIGAAGMLDPWDNAYQYLNLFDKKDKGGNRKDRKLNPLNSDFDLYSMGKDGQSSTQITQKVSLDDVIRANDGKFIDLAEKY